MKIFGGNHYYFRTQHHQLTRGACKRFFFPKEQQTQLVIIIQQDINADMNTKTLCLTTTENACILYIEIKEYSYHDKAKTHKTVLTQPASHISTSKNILTVTLYLRELHNLIGIF